MYTLLHFFFLIIMATAMASKCPVTQSRRLVSVSVTPVIVNCPEKAQSESDLSATAQACEFDGTLLYFGTKVVSFKMRLPSDRPSQIPLSSVPTHFRKVIEDDITKLLKALHVSGINYGSFSYVPKSSQLFVYIFPNQVKNSSVGIQSWDDIAIISEVKTDINLLPAPVIDLQPFFKDNVALAAVRKDDNKLQAIYSGQVQADDSGKYTWLKSHSYIDWNEETWVTRLYHCLKEQERNLGIQVINISQRGPNWKEWLQTILFHCNLPTTCTAFKGVSDIVLQGENGFVTIDVMDEDVYSSLVDLISGIFVIEAEGKSRVCERSCLSLPDKLGELLSSCYLLGALKALTDMTSFRSFTTYGLLLIRHSGSIGVKLQIFDDRIPAATILWVNSDMDRVESELIFLLNKIK